MNEEKEMCINEKEYQRLLSDSDELRKMVKEINATVHEINSDMKIVKPTVEKNNILISGNSHPESGIIYRLMSLEEWKADRQKIIADLIREEKEGQKESKNRHWEVIKPIIVEMVKLFVLGGGLYAILK